MIELEGWSPAGFWYARCQVREVRAQRHPTGPPSAQGGHRHPASSGRVGREETAGGLGFAGGGGAREAPGGWGRGDGLYREVPDSARVGIVAFFELGEALERLVQADPRLVHGASLSLRNSALWPASALRCVPNVHKAHYTVPQKREGSSEVQI